MSILKDAVVDVERRRILGLLKEMDQWLSAEVLRQTAQRLAASNAGQPSDRYLFRAEAFGEVRTELAAVIAEVDEPEVSLLPTERQRAFGDWGPRDWVEDFDHENGCYQNRCIHCGHMFNGHKRRDVCAECSRAEDGQ